MFYTRLVETGAIIPDFTRVTGANHRVDGGAQMNQNEKKQKYERPKVLASYEKDELEALIRPEGHIFPSPGGKGI